MKQVNPNIRIFISSTFLDMQNERDVLNQDVFPLIKGRLDKLGVNFTIVDLRWGITKEDQIKNNVIDLCLEEINHCKPYFIGLIGNRYGWCPDKLEEDLLLKFPFIRDNQDKSVTEMEMILGALAANNKERCFFYFKDEKLFDESTSDHKEEELKTLKSKIKEQKIKNHDYTSYDEFKEKVLEDLIKAIEEDYPSTDSTTFIKQSAYMSLLESKYVNRLFMTAQGVDVITYGEQNHVAVCAYSKEPVGKSTVLAHIINGKANADKIIINLKADHSLCYFPAYGLYNLLSQELDELGYELRNYPDAPSCESSVSAEAFALAELSNLKRNLYDLKLERPLYILINDINMLYDNDISQAFVRHFLFDDKPLPNNLYVYMTTNSEKQVRMTEHLKVIEMHEDAFGAQDFFKSYIGKYAKKIDQEILDKANKKLKFIDYKLIADYLIFYCNFSSYMKTSEALLALNNTDEILMYILNDFLSKLSPKCASLLAEILIRLVIFEIGMSESMIFDSYDKKTAIEEVKEHQVYVDISEIEKASIMRALRYFTDSSSGTILVDDNVIKTFLKNNVKYLFDVVSASYKERSEKAVNDLFDEVDIVSKYGRTYTKEEYLELLRNNDEQSRNISYSILDPLSAYLNKIIKDNVSILDEDSYYPYDITDREISLLSFIQESARIYVLDTRLDLYQNLLSNKEIMLFVAAKSKTLARRLVANYFDLYCNVSKSHYGKPAVDDAEFSINYTFEYLLDKYDGNMKYVRNNLLVSVIFVLYEKNIYKGKLVEAAHQEGISFLDIKDYATSCCTDEAYTFMAKSENMLFGEVDVSVLRNCLLEAYKGYMSAVNLNDNIIYAHYYFRVLYLLIDNDLMENEEYQRLLQILQTLERHLSFCFYPEVLGLFELHSGRLDPSRLLYRMKIGLNIMKYLGFESSLETHEETYNYLKEHVG